MGQGKENTPESPWIVVYVLRCLEGPRAVGPGSSTRLANFVEETLIISSVCGMMFDRLVRVEGSE